MEFVIKNISKSINDLIRIIGYRPTYFQPDISRRSQSECCEISIVRQMGRNDYPRFHLYIKENNRPIDRSMGLSFIFNLHLDQKKPSYKGSRAHSGEYDGELVEGEAKRIRQLLS